MNRLDVIKSADLDTTVKMMLEAFDNLPFLTRDRDVDVLKRWLTEEVVEVTKTSKKATTSKKTSGTTKRTAKAKVSPGVVDAGEELGKAVEETKILDKGPKTKKASKK